MKTRLTIILFLTFTFPAVASAMRVVHENGTEIHETTGETLIESFVDDVISLLPEDLALRLKIERSTLLRYASFTPRDNYWSSPASGKKSFIARHAGGNSGTGSEALARNLGLTVQDIFEIAMTPADDDLLGERVRGNLVKILDKGRFETYAISYRGFHYQELTDIVDRLYSLQRFLKMDIYPEMVIVTADLWSALWQRSGHEVNNLASSPKTFIRRPFMSVMPLPKNGIEQGKVLSKHKKKKWGGRRTTKNSPPPDLYSITHKAY